MENDADTGIVQFPDTEQAPSAGKEPQQWTGLPELPDPRTIPFEQRRAMAVRFMQEWGVDWRGRPVDAGSHVIVPKIDAVDLFAEKR